MAEYRDAPVHPIAPRLLKDPKPHVDDATYLKDHESSIKNPDEFWTKVSAPYPSPHKNRADSFCSWREK